MCHLFSISDIVPTKINGTVGGQPKVSNSNLNIIILDLR